MKFFTKIAAICAVCVLTSLSALAQEAVQPSTNLVAANDAKTVSESTETVKPKAEETKATPAKRQSSDAENWKGFYIGANVGGTVSRSRFSTSAVDCSAGGAGATSTNPTTGVSVITNGCILTPILIDVYSRMGNQEVKPKGFSGGVQAGYNFQSGRFVAGVETDFNSFRQNETITVQENIPSDPRIRVFTQTIKTDWLMTVRPRAGFTAGKALIYGTGGVAVTKLNYESFYRITNFTLPAAGSGFALTTFQNTIKETKAGWTAGAGAEFKASDNWSVKGEYLYTQFNASGNTVAGAQGIISTGPAAITPAPNSIITNTVKLQSHIFRFGVNYRF